MNQQTFKEWHRPGFAPLNLLSSESLTQNKETNFSIRVRPAATCTKHPNTKNTVTERFVLLRRPTGIPDESIFGLEKVQFASGLRPNELRLHGMYYSVDPYMRGRMNDAISYMSPFAINEPLEGGVVATVIESNSPSYKEGDFVFGQLPWATEIVVSSERVHRIDTTEALPSEYLGVLGMTGLTAYFGLLNMGEPKKGETVLISGAAGAVGSVAGQIAKIKECNVVGIVGTDEKAEVIKRKFKFDSAINYKKSPDLVAQIRQVCPEGVDIYFDNVGGEISDAVLQNMNFQGRIALCGQISLYNADEIPTGPRPQPLLLSRSILMQGFMVGNFKEHFAEATAVLLRWLTEGKLESAETIVEGFENLPKSLIGLFSGKNIGKMIVRAGA